MSIGEIIPQSHSAKSPPLKLEAGDLLGQPEFHERYSAMRANFQAELIEGTVIVPSPVSFGHSYFHLNLNLWLGSYCVDTPRTICLDNATFILGKNSEPQPDIALILDQTCGGQTSINEDGFAVGAPELVVEVATSSASYDLHGKFRDYQRAGVKDYVVVLTHNQEIRWFTRHDQALQPVSADNDGIFRSQVFPGLWLHRDALLLRDMKQVINTLQQGLADPSHTAFVDQLAQAGKS